MTDGVGPRGRSYKFLLANEQGMSDFPSQPREETGGTPPSGESPVVDPLVSPPTEAPAHEGSPSTRDVQPADAEAHASVNEAASPHVPPEAVPAESVDSTPPAPTLPSQEEQAASRSLEPGSIRYGTVTEVTTDEVVLNLADQVTGRVPFIEFAGHPTPKVGDDVSVIVEQYDPASNTAVLSKRHADEVLFWHTVQPGDSLEGVVTGMNKGGLDIDIGGARAFLPASHVDTRKLKDISTLIGEHVQVIVTQVDRTTKDLVVSRRKAIERHRKEQRQSVLNSLVEGELATGRVTNLTEYGAFVSLGGADGLIHITDLSWGRVTDPAEIVQTGQEVTVRVLKVDRQKGKISLGLKQATPDPWESVESRYPAGSRIKAKIARLADFGAFLELEKGVDALLPLSEMSWSRRVGRPEDHVRIGQEVEVQVLKVEPEKRRISVGLRQLLEDPWSSIETRFPVDGKVRGKVARIVDFGAFVELAPGVEGLIHISELSPRRVNTVSDVVKEGQEVEVRILKIDTEAQRISLSMKPPQQAAPARPEPVGHDRSGKKRKKPLRGGLSSHFEW